MLDLETIGWLGLTLTSDCNFRCKYCYMSAGDVPRFYLPFSHAKNFLDYFSPYSRPGLKIDFSGGEPTMHKDLIKIIDYAEENFLDPEIQLVTNGFFSDKILEKLLKRNVKFQITFEGLPKIHDYERPAADGSKTSMIVLKNIKRISEEKPEVLTIRMNYSPLKFGREEEIADFLSSLGVRKVSLGVLVPRGRGENYEYLNEVESVKREHILAEALEKHNIETNYKKNLKPMKWVSCGAGKNSFFLSADSHIVGCQSIALASELSKAEEIFVFGKVNSKGVYIDEERLKRFIDFAYSYPEKCKSCPAKNFCGCPLTRATDLLCSMFISEVKARNKLF